MGLGLRKIKRRDVPEYADLLHFLAHFTRGET
jgi:hypothetical protein